MIHVACLAARNMLRSSLTNFYTSSRDKIANCRLMPDERPIPSCGQEFISIYAHDWRNLEPEQYALHEKIGITIAVTQKTGHKSFDRIGNKAILDDEDAFVQQSDLIIARIREVVSIIHPDYATFAAQMETLLTAASGVDKTMQSPYDKLTFVNGDAWPKIVGPEHFHGEDQSVAPSGLLMKAYFSGSARLHWLPTLDGTSA